MVEEKCIYLKVHSQKENNFETKISGGIYFSYPFLYDFIININVRQTDLREDYDLKKMDNLNKGANVHVTFSHTRIDAYYELVSSCFFVQIVNHLHLLRTLADSVSTFMNDLKLLGVTVRVLIMRYFEFARRVEKYGYAGTDFGITATSFVITERGIYG